MASPASSSSSPLPMAPVFVFPPQVNFYLDDPSTHKRVITLYNPYDVDVAFKVLCNNPKRYAVVEPEGRIVAQKCVDIVIRHVAVSPQSAEHTDKFRIHLFDLSSRGAPGVAAAAEGGAKDTRRVIGRKDILATLHSGLPDSDEKNSHSLPHQAPLPPSKDAKASSHAEGAFVDQRGARDAAEAAEATGGFQSQQILAMIICVFCLVGLFLPTEGDDDSATLNSAAAFFKDYPMFHLTVVQKCSCAYVLGLCTMVMFR